MSNPEEEDVQDDELDEGGEFGLDIRSQIFLAMRQQNLSLLKIAAEVSGYSKSGTPLRPEDARKALKTMWEIYSEIYSWVDPEESDEDGDEEEE
jgi:hypothetical protein